MKRFRKNILTHPEVDPGYAARIAGASERITWLTTLGLVVNPKKKELLLSLTDGDYVSIRSLKLKDKLKNIGTGYHSGNHEVASDFTGLPRVHTPSGVVEKGGGYGTSLYTALCLGAHLVWNGDVRISMSERGNASFCIEIPRSAEGSELIHLAGAARR